MRIRIFRAFASNNSGSYTIVGRFESVERAEEVAAELRAVCAEHDAWFEANADPVKAAPTPLEVFARAKGLTAERAGQDDDWPEFGDPPQVLAVDTQVILHAKYTVTMPRLFGEYFYARGGRVDLELVHSHEPIVVTVDFWIPDARWDDPSARDRTEALRQELEPLLEPVTHPPPGEGDPIPPAFRVGPWGNLRLSAVFGDLVAGVELVRRTAVERGFRVRATLREGDEGVADPLALLRTAKV